MIIEFLAKPWKWHMLFDLLRIIESTGFARNCMVLNNIVRSELIQTSS